MKAIGTRLSALILSILLALSLTACGNKTASAQPPDGSAPAQTPSAETPSSPPADDPSDTAAQPDPAETGPSTDERGQEDTVSEDGWYSSKDEVALYLHLYGHLPENYITKQQAEDLGWTGGSVERWAGEGMAIGGGRFGNYEGLLPAAQGRTYTECDIDTVGTSSRGAKRIVFSNDGLIYYTEDHYESFELLYGEP